MFDLSDALLAGLWGGLLALERRAFLQAMASRPLVAGSVMGVMLGDVPTGVAVGLVFELLHLGMAALGAALPDHDTLPTVSAAALAGQLGHASGHAATPAMWACAILLAAPLGRVGRWMEQVLDRRARRYLGRALATAQAGDAVLAARQNLRAMWAPFAAFALVTGLMSLWGDVLALAWPSLPPRLVTGLELAFPALGVAAAGVAVQGSNARGRLAWGAVAAVVMFLVVEGSSLLGGAR